jgi:hypothetical protein
MSALIKCRKCHRKFDPFMSLGKRGKPITTRRDCSATESRATTFKSLPAYDDSLTSLRDFINSNPSGSCKWQHEFRHTNETLKDLTSAIARGVHEITGM